MNDTASLQNLHDIVLPPPVSWWPPAPGWYAILAIVLLALGWAVVAVARRRRANRYRREALLALDQLQAQAGDQAHRGEALGQLPVLLKRVALTAFPRRTVASLSGADWHRFLDQSADLQLFAGGLGLLLDRVSFYSNAGADLSTEEYEKLFSAAKRWVKTHKPATKEAR